VVPDAASSQAPVPWQQYPLFEPQLMAPDTPPLMIELLINPTEANAARFLAWQQARQQRMIEVQHLLRTTPRPQPGE
jgi:hypothetical protein